MLLRSVELLDDREGPFANWKLLATMTSVLQLSHKRLLFSCPCFFRFARTSCTTFDSFDTFETSDHLSIGIYAF